MSTKIAKPLTLAFIGSLSVASLAHADTAFQLNQLAGGYMTTGFGEGKCGEGKCGVAKMDTNKDGSVSKAEFEAAGGKKFDAIDTDKNGSISEAEFAAHKKAHEGKCGEGKCGGKTKEGSCGADKKKAAEGKCGEGKCGGSV
ncbi:MAG TPA: EF-hand domain-containing protein [Tahibacter sp.]|nr:EF-hand domain-containing protein [Tahibacter sp.]